MEYMQGVNVGLSDSLELKKYLIAKLGCCFQCGLERLGHYGTWLYTQCVVCKPAVRSCRACERDASSKGKQWLEPEWSSAGCPAWSLTTGGVRSASCRCFFTDGAPNRTISRVKHTRSGSAPSSRACFVQPQPSTSHHMHPPTCLFCWGMLDFAGRCSTYGQLLLPLCKPRMRSPVSMVLFSLIPPSNDPKDLNMEIC